MDFEELNNIQRVLEEEGYDCNNMSTGELMFNIYYNDCVSLSLKEKREKETIRGLLQRSDAFKNYKNKDHIAWLISLKKNRQELNDLYIEMYTNIFNHILSENSRLMSGYVCFYDIAENIMIKTNKNYNNEKDKKDLIKVFERYIEDFEHFIPHFIKYCFEKDNILENKTELEKHMTVELTLSMYGEIYGLGESSILAEEDDMLKKMRENLLNTFLEKEDTTLRVKRKI